MKEIWKDIDGYKGIYQVNSIGVVKRIKAPRGGRSRVGKILKPSIVEGYYMIHLCADNKHKQINVHRLVAQSFIPNPNNKPQVNHKDCNKLNNSIDNLEWVTYKENSHHAIRNNRYVWQKKKYTLHITLIK